LDSFRSYVAKHNWQAVACLPLTGESTETSLDQVSEAGTPVWSGDQLVLEDIGGVPVVSVADLRSAPLPARAERLMPRWQAFFELWRALPSEAQRKLSGSNELAVIELDPKQRTAWCELVGAAEADSCAQTGNGGEVPCEAFLVVALAWRASVATEVRASPVTDPRLTRALTRFALSEDRETAPSNVGDEFVLAEWFEGSLSSFLRLTGEKSEAQQVVVDRRCEQRQLLVSPGRYRLADLWEAAAAACATGIRRVAGTRLFHPLCPEEIAWRRAAALLAHGDEARMAQRGQEWSCSLARLPAELRQWALESDASCSSTENAILTGKVRLSGWVTVSLEDRLVAGGRPAGTPRSVWLY
jgi:hypothetical protein